MTECEVSVLFWGISGQMPSRCWAHTPLEWLQNGFWEPFGDTFLLGMAAKRLLGAFCRPLPLLQARACSRAEARFKTLTAQWLVLVQLFDNFVPKPTWYHLGIIP